MALLVDGYNLIHAANIVGRGLGPRGLERARQALMDTLAAALPDAERARTTIVFDAAASPPGLPREINYQGMTIRFATGYESADELLEELIGADSAPKRLTVVSSDHRVQRAARKRRATAIDSDVWFAEVQRQRKGKSAGKKAPASDDARGTAALSQEEIEALARDVEGESRDDLSMFPPEPTDEYFDEEL
ncbi:MAG: NYN domain-containing protein [Pirellulales bacterium]|nr:NYN domain-containing protein [Pirellulales bacterium]